MDFTKEHIGTTFSVDMITVELTEEMVREMLPVWESQRTKKREELLELEAKIRMVKQKLGITEMAATLLSASSIQGTLQVLTPQKTPHGKSKRGESRNLISEFLKSRNGSGASIKEITAETGTVYGTARRILRSLAEQNKVVVKKRLWTWAG